MITEVAGHERLRVGFVGLGTMGGPMAASIARADLFDLVLYDVDSRRAAEIADRLGAEVAPEPNGLADCAVVVLMLPTSAIVRSALFTSEGDLRIPLATGSVVVDMSSSDPLDTTQTGKMLARHGIGMVDAPVSGARERAENGTLSIMLGTDDEIAARTAIPLIETMSSQIFRTGKLGSGHAMKALNNFVAAAGFAATAEALVAGTRFGLDPTTIIEVINASTGQNFSSLKVMPAHVVGGAYSTGFALPLITKDVHIAARLQESVGHKAPICDAVAEAFSEALDALGNVDHSRAHQFWESR